MKVIWHLPSIFVTQIWGADGRDGRGCGWYFNTFLHIFCGFCLVWLWVWWDLLHGSTVTWNLCPEHSWVHLMILWLLVKTCRIPHLLKGAQIIFRGFCVREFSLRKKKGFISPWRQRRKEGDWEKEGQGSNGKIGKRKWVKASGLEQSMNGEKNCSQALFSFALNTP